MRVLRIYAALITLIILFPLAAVIVGSLTTANFVSIPPQHWGLTWYDAALHNQLFVSSFEFSVEAAIVASVLGTAIGTACAVSLSRSTSRSRGVILGLVMAPLLIPHILIAVGIVLLCSKLHLQTAPLGVFAGQTAIVIPFVVRVVMAGLSGMDWQLESAARTLGAKTRDCWRHIIVPLMAPAIVAAGTIAFLVAFDESVISFFTSTAEHTTLPVQIYNYVEQSSDPLPSAVCSIMVVVAAVVIIGVEWGFGLLNVLSGGLPKRRGRFARAKRAEA